MYKVYAIYNKKHNKIYIGQTFDLEKRLLEYNNHIFKGYTSRYDGVWSIIYQEHHKNRVSALKRESQLKSYRGRQFIKSNIPL
jgi:predicted GIY-YIG superfamily endonuclease